MPARVMILKEHGTNCEEESKHAFEQAGGKADIVHMEDLIRNKKMLSDYQILMLPGGFSYGDDTGSAYAWANRIRNHLWDETLDFVSKDRLVLGICNGFQALVNLGLLPATDKKYGTREAALVHNNSARYIGRWVDIEFGDSSPWTQNLYQRSFPVANGEGKFYAEKETLVKLNARGLVAARYIKGAICGYQDIPANPNGSLEDIAGIKDETGRILGMMPHPERALFFEHLPQSPLIREALKRHKKETPKYGPGLQIFQNGVGYFK